MRSAYDDHHHGTPNHHFQPKTIYLPMFCRLSLKDVVKLNNNHSHRNPKTSSAAAGEPSSPKVSCIGQVKRNNRVIAFPTTAPASANHHKHAKQKSVRPNAGRRSSSSSRENMITCVNSSNSRRQQQRSSKTDSCFDDYDGDRDRGSEVVDIGEMDPPLPVVKKVAPPGVEVNIWKRRFKGVAELRGLRIEQVQSPPIL